MKNYMGIYWTENFFSENFMPKFDVFFQKVFVRSM